MTWEQERIIAFSDIKSGLGRSHLWLTLARDDAYLRYRRSVLGPLWITLGTGFFILVLSTLWVEILGKQAQEFVPWVSIGVVAWQLISAVVTEGTNTFSTAASIIHNIPMPLSVHVFRAVLRHLINFAHNFLIVVFILLLFPPPASSAILLFIPGLLIVITMAVVCSTVLGILGARYRDFSYAVTMFMGPMFFLTPILWAPDVLSGARALVAAANPFTHFVALIREPLLGRAPEVFSYCYALGLLVAAALIALHLLGKHRNQVPYWIA